MKSSVFLGLVTHEASRFADSRGPDGLVHVLARHLATIDVASVVHVNSENGYSPALLPLTRDEVLRSIQAELDTEKQRRRYVSPTSPMWALTAFMAARRAYRTLKYAPPWVARPSTADPGPTMLRRLVNIELSHMDLMQAAVDSGSEWALIVEDDAHAEEPLQFARDLAAFVHDRSSAGQPKYVNVSRSFTEGRLGVDVHMTEIAAWGAGPVMSMSSDLAVTNTVCAILYRASFLADLLAQLQQIPLSPVLPIDWKLNAAILRMASAGSLTSGDCWFLTPAPIEQRSMA